MINPDDTFRRHQIPVLGRQIAYVDEGAGPSIVFLHGTGTHSYYWRNLIRYLTRARRCIAPDWMGMGKSEKRVPSGRATYTYAERRLELDTFLELVECGSSIIFVAQEMGTVHAIDWAKRHPSRVTGLVVIEGVLGSTNADILPPDSEELLLRLRSDEGEDLTLRQNAIVEQYVPMLVQRKLSQKELDRYREPYVVAGESRRAPLTMLREIPLKQDQGPIDDQVEELRLWLAESDIPKLVVGGDPGYLMPPEAVRACSRWPATRGVSVPGLHYVLEDSPERITSEVQEWLSGL